MCLIGTLLSHNIAQHQDSMTHTHTNRYTDLTDLGLVMSEDRKHECPRAMVDMDATDRPANIFSITDTKRQMVCWHL
jgi:hypothetical protein